MKLVYESNEKEVKVGDIAQTFRGQPVQVTDIQKPHKPSSTGRVYVKVLDTEGDSPLRTREFFPSVIGARWIES